MVMVVFLDMLRAVFWARVFTMKRAEAAKIYVLAMCEGVLDNFHKLLDRGRTLARSMPVDL